MTVDLLVDNDVLIKCACYALLDGLRIPSVPDPRIGILGSARYVVSAYLRRRQAIANRDAALAQFERFLTGVEQLEPTDDELALATALEEESVRRRLDLDGGESILCAIAIKRGSPRLLTGDKRAICSAELVQKAVRELAAVRGLFICLEQMIAAIILRGDGDAARKGICAEPDVDKALSICFSCSSAINDAESTSEGLASYIRDLRGLAPTMLCPDDGL